MAITESDPQLAQPQLTLGREAARQLATTTKSPPQMQEITPRWLMRMLPWVPVEGGVFRLNRRLTYELGDGRVSFITAGGKTKVIPQELCKLPILAGYDDLDTLTALAGRFSEKSLEPGEVIIERGTSADRIGLVAAGKVAKVGIGKYGEETDLGVLSEGDHFSYQAIQEHDDSWPFTARAITQCTVLVLTQPQFWNLISRSESLAAHIEQFRNRPRRPQNRQGEAAITISTAHEGEADIPGTFVDYDPRPWEYHLSATQTVLRVHTRIADLYNQPFDQTVEQLRLTVEAIRERQEYQLINSPDFGFLANAHSRQRITSRAGPPTPGAMDELLSRRRKTRFMFAHPRTIAAFGRECTKRGIYPKPVDLHGTMVWAWREIPLLPCDKIPISDQQTSSVIAMRIGMEDQGVVGLQPESIPDEYQPGLSVRFDGISEKSIISYLVTGYHSAAILVPDALGVLENVEVGQ